MTFRVIEKINPVGSTTTIGAVDRLTPGICDGFIGINSFNDSGATVAATPTGGTYLVQIETIETDGFQAIAGGTLNAADVAGGVIKNIPFIGHPVNIKITPVGIVGATHFRVKIVQSSS